MAFESLSDRFQNIIKKIKGQTKLTEANMEEMLKEIRVALLEADVNFKVVKEFVNSVKQKALGQEVFSKVSPGQMVVKIVHDELVELLGADQCEINLKYKPTIIMMCGLQGSGKTTTAGKLALLFKNKLNKKVLLVAGDIYRPAAIDQLVTVGKQVGVEVLNMGDQVSPVEIAKLGVEKAKQENFDVVIIDTAGRLQIDEVLMQELVDIENTIHPHEELLLVDAMSGQDAVNVANTFNSKLHLTGMIMSKLDGDARGGASLSIKHLTGIPIKYAGVGEKLTDLEVFHPDRMADRILGMGDIVTLVEKVKEEIDEKEAKKAANKMLKGTFDLNDMLQQLEQFNKISMSSMLKLIPGMPKISEEDQQKAKDRLKRTKSVIQSMTPEERARPDIIKHSRKVRIAKGCGLTNQEVNQVLKQHEQMKEMMKQFKGKFGGKMPKF